MADLKRLSKFLALVLRHEADSFGLDLDENGFTDTELVWQLIHQKYASRYSREDLETIVAGDENGKKRYEIVDNQIRALFGHSTVRDISYPIATPPDILYHGTSMEAIPFIKQDGLLSQKRQYVHMTSNLDYAQRVANRHSKTTIILAINALLAHQNGVIFHQPETEHFLCKSIPAQFIIFDD